MSEYADLSAQISELRKVQDRMIVETGLLAHLKLVELRAPFDPQIAEKDPTRAMMLSPVFDNNDAAWCKICHIPVTIERPAHPGSHAFYALHRPELRSENAGD